MPLVLQRNEVVKVYEKAAGRGWVLPAFNSENLTTTEAILDAALEYSQKTEIQNLPIIIGITNKYKSRPQSALYTHTRKWDVGLRLFLKELEILTAENSPYSELNVMIHLDHIQWDGDEELLNWDMGQFSSIMYDASTLPLNLNIEKTTIFREQHADEILIEGACDVIGKTSAEDGGLTIPADAKRYLDETGVDIVVANLGTEHRAAAADLHYRKDLAQEITGVLGKNCLCLHGTSSVSAEGLGSLFDDGIRRVNIWTALERDSVPVLFKDMLVNASKIIGRENIEKLLDDKLLGECANQFSKASLDYYTTTYRQEIVFNQMKKIITNYLNLWYLL